MAELDTCERNLKDCRVSNISVWLLTENNTKQQPKQLASSQGRRVATLLDIGENLSLTTINVQSLQFRKTKGQDKIGTTPIPSQLHAE